MRRLAARTFRLCLLIVSAGCAAEAEFTKEEAAALGGSKADGQDICALMGWYDDGVCDVFCPEVDPECVFVCEAYPVCAEGQTTHDSERECPQDTSCERVSVCGTTIWCSGAPTACPGENPAGCQSSGCSEGHYCDTAQGDAPSACTCDTSTGTWICTADVNGGRCVPHCTPGDPDCAVCEAVPTCADGETDHADPSECPQDASCKAITVCGRTIWCSGGTPGCAGPNPAGCRSIGCEPGFVCDTTQGDAPSGCVCDAESGAWRCTADGNGGICMPES